jgi:hypothetical protein
MSDMKRGCCGIEARINAYPPMGEQVIEVISFPHDLIDIAPFFEDVQYALALASDYVCCTRFPFLLRNPDVVDVIEADPSSLISVA